MHYFGMSYNEAYYKTPYTTLVMLSAAVPRYKSAKDEPKEQQSLASMLGAQLGNNDSISG